MNRVPSSQALRSRRGQKKAVKFVVMLVGPSGSGKSTFINTLCGREVIPVEKHFSEEFNPQTAHEKPGISFEIINEEVYDEDSGAVSLSFIDTPGFGDNLDNSECFYEILSYLEKQFDEVLAEENRIKRNPRFTDNRVHCLLYFVTPTGHGLRETDIEFMRLVATKVNIIPVLSKADTLTQEELLLNKRLVMEDLEYYNIPIYHFPYDSDSDEETAQQNHALREVLPFAIVGGSEIVAAKNGATRLVRRYPWGQVDVDDARVSDFPLLRDVLLRSHFLDLKETTFVFLYENYRTDKLSRDINGMSLQSPDPNGLGGETNGGGSTRHGTPMLGNGAETESVISTSYLAREEQLRQEEERLKQAELKVQEEIAQRRMELAKREEELRALEARLRTEPVGSPTSASGGGASATSPTGSTQASSTETVIKQEKD